MSSTIANLIAGDEAVKRITLTSGTGAQTVTDLSGASEVTFQATPTDNGAPISKTLTGGGVTFATDGADGAILVQFDQADGETAADLVAGRYRWRVIVTWADGTGPDEGDLLTWPSSAQAPEMVVGAR